MILAAVAFTLALSPRTINWSGRTWTVRNQATKSGPGPNWWSDSEGNVSVDASGALHLKVRKIGGEWKCSEIYLNQSLGYGTYKWTVTSPSSVIPQNGVLGLFTWSNSPEYANREIDIEISRWDAPKAANSQFTVQPYQPVGRYVRFEMPETEKNGVHVFTWKPSQIDFFTTNKSGKQFAEWHFAGSDRPVPGDEVVHINLWLNQGKPPTTGKAFEVVISKFEFTPL